MKAFFHYACKSAQIKEDPAESIKAPHIEKKLPEVLSMEETVRLLEQPSGSSPKELRDKAMLELLYATGMRVSELITVKLSDVNLILNYVVCRDGEKERVIPFGDNAKAALDHYLQHGRMYLVREDGSEFLFVNCSGSGVEPSGLLETDQAVRVESRDHSGYHTAYAAPFLCCTSGAERRGLKECSANAGSFRYRDDADLSGSQFRAGAPRI